MKISPKLISLDVSFLMTIGLQSLSANSREWKPVQTRSIHLVLNAH